MERQSFNVGIDRTVYQFDCILHESLVLGVTYTCRVYGTAVMFGKSFEVSVNDRFVAVTAEDGGLQVVRHYGHGRASEKMQRILTGGDKVFLTLGADGLAIGIVAARQDGDKHFHLPDFSRQLVRNLKPVTGKVNVHLVAGVMFHMAYGLGLKHIPPQQDTEIRMAVTIRMPAPVFLKEFAYRAPFPFQAGGVFRKESLQLDTAFGRFPDTRLATDKHTVKVFIGHFQHFLNGKAALLIGADILAHRVAGKAESAAYAFYSHPHYITTEDIF